MNPKLLSVCQKAFAFSCLTSDLLAFFSHG